MFILSFVFHCSPEFLPEESLMSLGWLEELAIGTELNKHCLQSIFMNMCSPFHPRDQLTTNLWNLGDTLFSLSKKKKKRPSRANVKHLQGEKPFLHIYPQCQLLNTFKMTLNADISWYQKSVLKVTSTPSAPYTSFLLLFCPQTQILCNTWIVLSLANKPASSLLFKLSCPLETGSCSWNMIRLLAK